MFVMCAFFCIVASGHHVKCGVAEYVFLKSGCDNRAKDSKDEKSGLQSVLLSRKQGAGHRWREIY